MAYVVPFFLLLLLEFPPLYNKLLSMSYLIDSTPDIFEEYQITKLTAVDELFIFTNYNALTSIIFNFEKRGLDARCIVQAVDYKNKKTSELRSRTLRFKIKSVFAPAPFKDEAVTFTGGGFTASVISKDNSYRLIAALPKFVMPSGKKGLKVDFTFSLESSSRSINELHTTKRFNETVHISENGKVAGTIRIEEVKKRINEDEWSVRRIRKTSTFPIRHNSYSSHGWGRENGEFSFLLSLSEKKCLFINERELKSYDGVGTKIEGDNEYIFTNDKEVDISFTNFGESIEKNGPFRKNRALKFGLFSGRIGDVALSSIPGYVVVQ